MRNTLIIAEAGINHNGNIELAKKLIKGAKEAGADIIKFQKRTVDKVYTKEELDKYRESPWGTTNREQKLGLEFSSEDYTKINSYCKEIGIDWMASCWDLESVEFIKQFDLNYNKIASGRIGHLQLLKDTARQGKHTFISTGMSTIEEIGTAINVFREYDCSFELMHTYSVYPANTENLNLFMIKRLRKTFGCKVGYSCHSPGIIFPVIAVALGATSIEKHITLDRTMYGSDQAASMELHGFKKMIEYIEDVEIAVGSGTKIIDEKEMSVRLKLWRDNDIQ
jgi:N-acetylneuraminate synthase